MSIDDASPEPLFEPESSEESSGEHRAGYDESRYGSSLDELAQATVPFTTDARLEDSGPATRALADRLQNEELTRTLVANTFWQAFLETETFRSITHYFDISLGRTEPIVVKHGNNYTLFLEHDGFSAERWPFAHPVDISSGEIIDGWYRAMSRRLGRWEGRRRPFAWRDPREVADILGLGPELALEASTMTLFHILFAPRGETELTCVPQPPACLGVATAAATAGAAVRDHYGRIGVTGPAHALPSQGHVNIYQDHNVYGGTVAAHEAQFTDGCFIALDRGDDRNHPVMHQTTQGPLKVAPRMHSTATFEGLATSPSATAIIKGINYELPYIDPFLQQTIRTDPVTEQGDSGAALLDDQGYIIGFAYSRNIKSSVPSHAHYSSWIWADAVFEKLKLVPY